MVGTRQRSEKSAGGPPARDNLRTVAFDSKGNRKYAVQVQRANNGNPCLRIVEGVPQDDGTFRKFFLIVWSEDFEAFFGALDEIRQFIRDENIRTPEGHVWKGGKRKRASSRKHVASAA